MGKKESQYLGLLPPTVAEPPMHWSLAPATSQEPQANKPSLPRQNSARIGTSGPPGYPEHYGRELGFQEDGLPGHAGHREINNTFFQPPASSKIEDHPAYPGRYAGEYKPGLKPQPYPAAIIGESRGTSASQGQPQQREAPVKEKEGGCCVIL